MLYKKVIYVYNVCYVTYPSLLDGLTSTDYELNTAQAAEFGQ